MLEQIRELMVEALNIEGDQITPNARLKEDLDIDSLSAVELVLELEEAFDVKIEDDELANFKTVQDIIDAVESKRS